MHTYFQPRISVEQEEADIKEMIDEEYERKEQENRDYYKQMEGWNVEREEKIKVLSEKIYNALIEGGDFSYDDIACAIAYLVGVVDGLSHRKHNTSNGSFANYVHYLIGEVNGVLDDKSKRTQSTEHPQIMIVQEEKKPCTSNEYVDLGLPSGLKWAKCNVGATSETDYGDYFMWGSTTPNTAEECAWEHTPFNNGDSYYNADAFKLVKDTACPNGVLAKEYDAATQIMGGKWRMPTKDELKELIDNTTNEWTQVNGVNGRKFTGSNGNSIFIPAAGICGNGSVDGVGKYGRVWSSSLSTSYHSFAWDMGFLSGDCSMDNYIYRYGGLSVRGVME